MLLVNYRLPELCESEVDICASNLELPSRGKKQGQHVTTYRLHNKKIHKLNFDSKIELEWLHGL